MSWNDESIRTRRALIKHAVAQGITDLQKIKEIYNRESIANIFDDGGEVYANLPVNKSNKVDTRMRYVNGVGYVPYTREVDWDSVINSNQSKNRELDPEPIINEPIEVPARTHIPRRTNTISNSAIDNLMFDVPRTRIITHNITIPETYRFVEDSRTWTDRLMHPFQSTAVVSGHNVVDKPEIKRSYRISVPSDSDMGDIESTIHRSYLDNVRNGRSNKQILDSLNNVIFKDLSNDSEVNRIEPNNTRTIKENDGRGYRYRGSYYYPTDYDRQNDIREGMSHMWSNTKLYADGGDFSDVSYYELPNPMPQYDLDPLVVTGKRPTFWGLNKDQWYNVADIATDFIPFVSTGKDIYRAINNPTPYNIGMGVLGVGMDLLGIKSLKNAYSAYKKAKIAKNARMDQLNIAKALGPGYIQNGTMSQETERFIQDFIKQKTLAKEAQQKVAEKEIKKQLSKSAVETSITSPVDLALSDEPIIPEVKTLETKPKSETMPVMTPVDIRNPKTYLRTTDNKIFDRNKNYVGTYDELVLEDKRKRSSKVKDNSANNKNDSIDMKKINPFK